MTTTPRSATLACKLALKTVKKRTSATPSFPAAQGKGIASEALRAVCDYAFNQTGVKAD
ncbi:protein YoaA [Enterobacter cancerogenus]|uniref:Protein YoaA n=1 Tax=Enterobacter cancerogenus TaxID=69218 RepID=A0A484Z7J2_9ENTR|nr:protein YoaA [Enterobacter cancerogenus]